MNLFGLEINFRKRGVPEEKEETRSAFSGYYGSDALTFGFIPEGSHSSQNLSAYYRGVDLISDEMAILPIRTVFKDGEIHESHPLNNVLENHYILVKMLVESVINRGNGYAYIERNVDGSVKSLRYLSPDDVGIEYNKQKNTLFYSCSLVSPKRIEPINMIHLRRKTVDGVTGISLITYASRILGIGSATDNAAKEFFKNGMNLSGILTVQGTLNDAQRTQIRESWNTAYAAGGSGLAILPGNMVYQPVQLSSQDSQLLQSRVFNVQEIARFLGVSPTLLGDLSQSSYNTLEQTQQQFLLHTLLPYIVMVEEEFTQKLLKPSERAELKINLDEKALLRTDKSTQASYYGTLLDKGVLSPNEVRKELGYQPVDGLDKHIIAYTDISMNTLENNDGKDKLNKQE